MNGFAENKIYWQTDYYIATGEGRQMRSAVTKVLLVIVIVSLTTAGAGLVLLGEEPNGSPAGASLDISPNVLNLGSNGNYMLFKVEGLGETPETFKMVGMDLGWDLLGPSAPIASFNDVTTCQGGASPEITPICILEKEDPTDPTGETRFKVSRELVSSLAEQACEMGGCHPLDEGRKSRVNVTMWGEGHPGQFFEVNDLLEVVPQCAPCKVTVTLVSIVYSGDDVGDDWRINAVTNTSKGKTNDMWIPGKHELMDINHGDTVTLNEVIFQGVVGKKGDRIWVQVSLWTYEIDPVFDDWDHEVDSASGYCPFEKELTYEMSVLDVSTTGSIITGKLSITVKVVADP